MRGKKHWANGTTDNTIIVLVCLYLAVRWILSIVMSFQTHIPPKRDGSGAPDNTSADNVIQRLNDEAQFGACLRIA